MQASKSTIMSLIGSNYSQFKIPIYQRTYDWKTKHCEKLVKDIFEAMNTDKEHFTGSIVYFNEKNFSQQKVSLIIDGQQRITTVILVLRALSNLANKLGHKMMEDQIKDKYLLTDTSDFKKVYKLIPTEEDEEQFELFMQNRLKELDSNSSLYQNYLIVFGLLESKLNTLERLTKFYQTLINQMTIVELVLDRGIDDPQEIFESINSTGLELSQADLIRNFLLMSASEQDYLYKTYWKPLFKMLGQQNIEDFMFNYLMYKTQKKLRYDEIYNNFIEAFNELKLSREEIMSELLFLGNIYSAFIDESDKYGKEVMDLLHSFTYLEQTTIFPFLLRVFKDFEENLIEETELIKVLNFFLTYHIKRIVVGSTSNSLRGLYINLYNRIFKLDSNKERYYDSIATFMTELKTKDEVPSDTQLIKNLQTIELYKQRKLVKFLLSKLENYEFNEKLLTDELSVEHVMPQTLQPEWKKMLGDNYDKIHEEYVHTLGNLTITGYNSTLSNKSFLEKKQTLKDKSKANYLNSDILSENKWTETEISARSKRLAKAINDIYQIPVFKNNGLRFESVEEHDCDYEYEDIKGKKPYSFKLINMDEEIRIDSYKNMLVEAIQILDSIDPRKMDDIAADLFNPWDEGTNDKLTNQDGIPDGQYHQKIRENLYLIGGFSAAGVIESIKKLMDYYDIDKNAFLFYTRVS